MSVTQAFDSSDNNVHNIDNYNYNNNDCGDNYHDNYDIKPCKSVNYPYVPII